MVWEDGGLRAASGEKLYLQTYFDHFIELCCTVLLAVTCCLEFHIKCGNLIVVNSQFLELFFMHATFEGK